MAAPVEYGRFVVRRSPWGRLGSVLDMRNRLHRIRWRSDHIYQFSQSLACLGMISQCLEFQGFESYGMPKAHAHAV